MKSKIWRLLFYWNYSLFSFFKQKIVYKYKKLQNKTFKQLFFTATIFIEHNKKFLNFFTPKLFLFEVSYAHILEIGGPQSCWHVNGKSFEISGRDQFTVGGKRKRKRKRGFYYCKADERLRKERVKLITWTSICLWLLSLSLSLSFIHGYFVWRGMQKDLTFLQLQPKKSLKSWRKKNRTFD